MKFVAAKCPNCGGRIKVDINKKIYHCEYCRNDIILDDGSPLNSTHTSNEYHLNKEELLKHQKMAQKFMIIPIVIFILIFGFVGYTIFNSFMDMNSSDSPLDNQTEVDNEVSTSLYNLFIDDVGVQGKFSTENLINSVIENINDYDKEIEVLFNNVSYKEISALVSLITEISNSNISDYSIINEKDSDGYINKIIINNVE